MPCTSFWWADDGMGIRAGRAQQAETCVRGKENERVGGGLCNRPQGMMTSLKSTDFQRQEHGVTLT